VEEDSELKENKKLPLRKNCVRKRLWETGIQRERQPEPENHESKGFLKRDQG
jgi:hypothetical protein